MLPRARSAFSKSWAASRPRTRRESPAKTGVRARMARPPGVLGIPDERQPARQSRLQHGPTIAGASRGCHGRAGAGPRMHRFRREHYSSGVEGPAGTVSAPGVRDRRRRPAGMKDGTAWRPRPEQGGGDADGSAVAMGLALLGHGLTGPEGVDGRSAGEGGRRAARGPGGGRFGPARGRAGDRPSGHAGLRGSPVSDHFFPLPGRAGPDRGGAVAPVVFVNATCQSPAFLPGRGHREQQRRMLNGLPPTDPCPRRSSPPGGIGPGDLLLGPKGAPIKGTPLARCGTPPPRRLPAGTEVRRDGPGAHRGDLRPRHLRAPLPGGPALTGPVLACGQRRPEEERGS